MAKRRNNRVEARRLAGLRERAKVKARSLIMKRGVATMAGAGGGALIAATMVKSGVKPTTAAAVITTAGVVGMATLDDIPRDIAVGIGGAGIAQLSLMLLTKSEVKSEVRNQPMLEGTNLEYEGVTMLPHGDDNIDNIDIADEFRNARDDYAAEYPATYAEDDRGPVLEVA